MGNQAEPGLLPGPGGTVYRPLSRRDFLPFLFPIPEHLPRSRNPHETPFYLFEVPRTKSSPPPRVLRTPPGPTHANRNKRGGGPVMARPVVPTRQSTVLVSSLLFSTPCSGIPFQHDTSASRRAKHLRSDVCANTQQSQLIQQWSARRPGATITHKVTRKQQLTTKVPAVSMLCAKWRKCASRKVPQLREHVQRLPRDCEWQPIPVDSARL